MPFESNFDGSKFDKDPSVESSDDYKIILDNRLDGLACFLLWGG